MYMIDPGTDNDNPNRSDDGLSVLDLASLSGAQLQVMRLVLRAGEITYQALCAQIDQLPETERLPRAELDRTLADLREHEWLTEIAADADRGTPNGRRFKANLRRKSSRVVSDFVMPRSRRGGSSSTLRSIWDRLEKDES